MAVLVAIAIPIFTSQLEKSRDSVAISNIRAAYAEATTEVMTYTKDLTLSDTGNNFSITAITSAANPGYTVVINGVNIPSQVQDNWSNLSQELPWNVGKTSGLLPADEGLNYENCSVTFTISYAGEVTNCVLAKID